MSVRVIGIGASAGGLQALESFFSELPADLGVAFVVVQHLSRNYPSSMDVILQRCTNLTVKPLSENTLPQANHIYVKGPDVDVTIDDWLRVSQRAEDNDGLYLPIDEFFFSLAANRGDEAVGIILSGMGTDGSRGLKEIKARGGLVLVQSPKSAQFDGMPNASLRQNIADMVLPPTKLASHLTMIVRRENGEGKSSNIPQSLEDDTLFPSLLDRIYSTTRIDFKRYRPATIYRRIEKRMIITQEEPLANYIAYALNNETELQILRQSFLIGVTRFFRDKEAFGIIRDQIIPALIERIPADQDLRIWVPSCSTGEEAYTIAMLVDDYLQRKKIFRSFRIFGADVDRRSITVAARGEYDDTIQADVPPELLERYFIPLPHGYQVRPEIKDRMLFAVQNLLDDPPFIRVDFISCRNFLIYIDTKTQQHVLSNFYFGLNTLGYLMLGPSEHLGSLQSAFTTIDRRWKIYQKRSNAKLSDFKRKTGSEPNLRFATGNNLQAITLPSVRPQVSDGDFSILPPASRSSTMDQFSRYLSERYAPTTLFVNRNYDILYLNGDFANILHLPRFDAHLSLRTVVNEEAQSLLIIGVDRVLNTQQSGIFERINIAGPKQEPRFLKVRFSLFDDAGISEPIAMLEFMSSEEGANGVDKAKVTGDAEVYNIDRRLLDKVAELEAELLRSERRAQKLYNELEATNEELQSSNRELLASNEEMQSTNEELQSVNEELYTVNNEFQRKNDELADTNNDINNLLKSTQISTIFVDKKLNIRRFNPGVGQQFDLAVSDLGRPLTSFASPFADVDIEALARQVLEDGKRYDQEVADKDGDYYLLRLLPYLTEGEQLEGVVITFVDINDLVRTRQRLTDMATKYEAIFHNTQEVIAIVNSNSRIEDINRSLAGKSRKELLGFYFTDLVANDTGKVQMTESLRAAFDNQEMSFLTLNLAGSGDSTVRIEGEFIPIVTKIDHEEVVEQTMIVVHDVTDLNKELQQNSQVIQRYERIINNMRKTAGLIDMSEHVVFINRGRHLEHQPDFYTRREMKELLTPAGLKRYRQALADFAAGAAAVDVAYAAEEMVEESASMEVRYRPIYANNEIVFVSFEVLRE